MKKVFSQLLGRYLDFIASRLSIDAELLKVNSAIDTIVGELWNIFIIIAMSLTIIFFLIELNEKIVFEGRDLTLKSFFAPFLKLAVAYVVLRNGYTLMKYMIELANGLLAWVQNLIGTKDFGDYSQLKDDVNGSLGEVKGFFMYVFMTVAVIIGYLVACVVYLIILYKALLYQVELIFRISISPLALAEVYQGAHSGAIRWLKGLFGLAIYGCCFVILPQVVSSVFTNTFANTTKGSQDWMFALAMPLLLPIAVLGSLTMARNAIKEATS